MSKAGDKMTTKPIPELSSEQLARFWAHVDKTDTCWHWTGTRGRNGYGRFDVGTRRLKAHRVSYTLAFGAIPDGLTIDHLCRVVDCVNPSHLEPVSHKENNLRGFSPVADNARKTHCIYGHPFSGPNLHINKRGGRVCRVCEKRRKTMSNMRLYGPGAANTAMLPADPVTWHPLPPVDHAVAPFNGEPVLIATDCKWGGRVHRAIFTDQIHGSGIFGWAIEDMKFGPYSLRGYMNVTHWMPLPDPPGRTQP